MMPYSQLDSSQVYVGMIPSDGLIVGHELLEERDLILFIFISLLHSIYVTVTKYLVVYPFIHLFSSYYLLTEWLQGNNFIHWFWKETKRICTLPVKNWSFKGPTRGEKTEQEAALNKKYDLADNKTWE